jgi:branched-chain amino acid transport system permease protein
MLSIAVVLVEPRGLWGLVRRFLPEDVIPITRRPPAPAANGRTESIPRV